MYNKQTSWGKFFIIIAISIILNPFLNFRFAFLGGYVAKITIGNILCRGFASIGINLVPNQIPWLAGCLGWIGGFFKSYKN